MEIEKQRGISVTTSVMEFDYRDYKINILDTPGHQDFAEDYYRSLSHTAHLHQFTCLRFHTFRTVYNDDNTVYSCQCAICIFGYVRLDGNRETTWYFGNDFRDGIRLSGL